MPTRETAAGRARYLFVVMLVALAGLIGRTGWFQLVDDYRRGRPGTRAH